MAFTLGVDIVIIENVTQLLHYHQLLQDAWDAFDNYGFTLRFHKVINHYEVGGSSLRARVFFWLERQTVTHMLPPPQLTIPIRQSSPISTHLVPVEEVPAECRVHGDFVPTQESTSSPPIIGHIHHGGEHVLRLR